MCCLVTFMYLVDVKILTLIIRYRYSTSSSISNPVFGISTAFKKYLMLVFSLLSRVFRILL